MVNRWVSVNDSFTFPAEVQSVLDARTQALTVASVAGRTGAVTLTKNDVGLSALDANETALRIAADAAKIDKGTIVFNVKDYGAVGDWSSGTTGTVDTSAINSCLAAAAAAVGAGGVGSTVRVLVPATTGNGYIINDTITVPNGVDLDMQAPFVYTGPTGRAALIIGSSAFQSYRHHVIRLIRYALTDWTNEADAGLVVRNHYNSRFNVVQCNNFTIGATFIGDTNNGFSYNEIHLGALIDNKIAIDCTNDTGGWCNENEFFGGRLTVSSSTYTSLDRVGIRVTSRATTKYYNNANIFRKPSFELKGAAIAGVSTCMLMEYGTACRADAARHESNSPGVLVQQNNSGSNWMDFSYSDEGTSAPVAVLAGASNSGGITRAYASMTDRALRTIYKADAVHKKACYYDGGTSINVPGLTVGTSATGNTDARAASSLVLATDYLEIPNSRYAGFYMSTRALKQFTVLREVEAGFGGRIIIRCYDTSGTVISTAGAVQTSQPASNPTFATSYGGAWRTGIDGADPYHFGVSATVDFVFIGIAGGTATARARALSVATISSINPATWLAFPDNGQNYGTVPPTAGTWAVGREVVNAAPASGQPAKWICTVAGTPGTWVPLTGSTGAVFTPTDVQVFTASGTWTKPAGAVAVDVTVIGPGGAGGSGRRDAAGTVRCGGGGGGGGGLTRLTMPASPLPSTVAVTVATPGTGGAAVTTDATNGNPGVAGTGSSSLFGTYARASTGSPGSGGTTSTGTGGGGGVGLISGGAGSAASTTGGVGTALGLAPAGAGGPAGGGITSANVANNGASGSASSSVATSSYAGGVVDTTSPVAAPAGVTNGGIPGGSGGGGAASITTAAQAGVSGGIYGGGGSGGGASLNGFASGAGGDGGPGIVIVVTRF